MKCIYKIGNEELNNDMLNKLLNEVKVENVFSASAQFSAASDEMMDALSKIKSDAGYHTITKKDGGVEVTIDEANGISFNDFIDKAVNKNGEKWIKDFNEEEYKTALKAKVKANEAGLVFKGKTYTKNELSINDSVVDEYVETKVKQNQKTGEIGMSVHRAMTKIMNHKNEENNSLMFIKLDGDKFTDSKGNTLADDSATITFIDKLMEDANFKKMDLNAFVKFYNSAIAYKYKDIKNRSIATNYLTSSKDPISGKNIYALVDLVTIDNDGRVDLIFYNASNSDYTDWTEEKRERLVYKMMMARHLLISQGVSPKKIHVQVKPISINYDDDMNIINVFADKGDVNLNTLPASGKNTRFDNQTQGSYASNINEVIPLAPSCFSDSIKIEGIEDISKQMSHLFSSYKFRGRESESEYQDFISSKIKSSDNLEKGAWMYWNMFEKGYVYIADDGKSKEDSPNVRSAVVAYVTRRRDDSNNVLENIGEAINEILSGRKDLETALSSIFRTHNDKGKMYLSYILSKYSSDNNNNSTKWTALEIPELNAMGIIPIQNTITKQIDFISLTDYDPNASMKMKTDNRTIVGDFANLKNINSEYLLSGKLGNIELIKLMLVINKYYSVFATGGFQIGEIQVINPNLGTGMIASRKQLVSSFNTLLNLAKANTGVDIENNFKSGNIKFTNDINVFQSMFLNLCSKYDAVRSSVSVFGTQVKEINNMSEQSALALLYQIEDALTRSYPEYFTRDKMRVSVTKNNDVINLFKQITEAINMYEGGYMAQNENLTKFDIYFRNPDNIPSAIARMITEKVKGAFGQISAKMTAFSATIHNTIFDELYIYKGYGFANKMIGNQAVLFENLFEKEPGDENKIHHMMKVRNPFKDNSLSDSEKVFLKKFLFEVNTIRTRNDNSKKDKIKTWDDPAMESMINNDDMFLCIPLLQASSASKYTQGYYKDRIANSVKNMLSPGKVIGEMNERLHENMENYITPDERTNMNSSLNEYKMYNRFKVGETQEGREGILSSKEQSYWETNLENVLLEYKYAALREDELKRPLLYAKALTYQTLLWGQEAGQNVDNTIKYIDEYIKSGVYEMSLVEDDSGAKKVEPYVQKLRGFVTAISLGFSVKNFFRDSVEGIWKNSFSISHNDGRYDFEDLMASAKEMMFNVPASFDKVTLIEQICNYGRIANIDINRSAESLKSNKQGLFNFMSRGMYSCISAPDYMNRMTIFIAMMIHDGCYDALSIKNEEIKYDWKKDKRFSIYAKGDTSNPKYNEQRAAWLSLLNGFRNEFPDIEFKESLTQELPFPYLRKQIDGFKNYADTIYGFYDTDVKSMAEKTFLGMVFMQFRTYISGSLKKMTLKPGFYNEGKAHQGIDETTGKKIWFDKDGNPSISEEAEKLGMPYMVYGNTFNQGMWYSVKDSFKTLVSGTGMTQEMITKYGSGMRGRIHAIMDNNVDSRNLKWLGCDLMRWLIQMMIAYFVFEAAKKALTGKRDASNYKEIAAKKSMLKFGEEVFVQSMGDFNYLDIANSSVLDISSSTFSVTTRIAKRMKNIVFDDDTKAFDLFLKDTGFGRMFNEFGEAYKYGKKLEEM